VQIFRVSIPSRTSSLVRRCRRRRRRRGLAHQHRIEPAAAALAAGDRAEFMAAVAQLFADLVVQLGGEGALAHAGGVGLDDAQHVAPAWGPTPEPAAACPATCWTRSRRDRCRGRRPAGSPARLRTGCGLPARIWSPSMRQAGFTKGATWGVISANWARMRRERRGRGPGRRAAPWWASSRSILVSRASRSCEVGEADGPAADLVLIGRADAASWSCRSCRRRPGPPGPGRGRGAGAG
jgi:hypothetical protein